MNLKKTFQHSNAPSPSLDVSIIIPAKNEEENIGKCLEAIYNQETNYRFEVIVIDSGSSDQTMAIVKKYSPVQLVEIQPGEFGHGKTRNLGAQGSQGDYIVFLNADAIPVDKHWLNVLIDPLTKDKKIAGVYSRHIPKEGCYLYMIRDIQKSMPGKPMVRSQTRPFDFMIFSTVSCAIPREIWRKYPFKDDITIAEDQEWAGRLLDQGFKIVYKPASRVYHSHNYTPRQLFEIKRNVAKSTGRFKTKFSALVWGFVLMIGGMKIKIAGDILFIFFRFKGPFSRKVKEVKTSFKARKASFFGRYKGWISGNKRKKGKKGRS
ncbi:MAG: glycosyltransferase family A protein [Candidatus Aminicenantes bacterium]